MKEETKDLLTGYNVKTDSIIGKTIQEYDILNAYTANNYNYLINYAPEQAEEDVAGSYIVKNALLTALSIAAIALNPAGGIALGIGFSVANGFASALFDITGDESRRSQVWEKVKGYVEGFVNQRITTEQFNRMAAKLDGLAYPIKLYGQAFNRNDKALAYDQLIISINAAGSAISEFKQKEIEVVSLPLYAQAALMHLLLMRDFILFGQKKWNVSDADLNVMKNEYRRCLISYRKHIKDTYKAGLEKRKTEVIPYGEGIFVYPSVDYAEEVFTATARWNYVNQYTAGMKIATLSLAALFPLTDPTLYEYTTNVKHSSEIYSPMIGLVNSRKTVDEIDKIVVKGGYPGGLTSLETGSLDTMSIDHTKAKIGIAATRQGFATEDWDALMGWQGNVNELSSQKHDSIYCNDAIPITEIFARHESCPGSIRFIHNVENLVSEDLDKTKAKNEIVGPGTIYTGRKFSISYPGYKLSSVTSLDYLEDAFREVNNDNLIPVKCINMGMGVVFGFRERSSSYRHELKSLGYTQVPAEMYSKQSNTISYPEILNGQNAVLTNNSGNAYVEYNVYSPFNACDFELNCNVAYKGANDVNLRVIVNGKFEGYIQIKNTTALPMALEGEYGSYSIFNFPNLLSLKEGKNVIRIEIPVEMAIDRIEFLADKASEIMGENYGKIRFYIDFKNGGTMKSEVVNNGNMGIGYNDVAWGLYVDGVKVKTFNERDPVSQIANEINGLNVKGTNFWLTKYPEKLIYTIGKLNVLHVSDHFIVSTQEPNSSYGTDPNKRFYVYAGGKLVYSFRHTDKYSTVVSVINALNIKSTVFKIVDGPLSYAVIKDDMIQNLFDRNENYSINYSKLSPLTTKYEIKSCEDLLKLTTPGPNDQTLINLAKSLLS